MTITPKIAQQVMKILKLSEIRIPICDTTKGHLAMQIRWEEHDFNFILDAVPVDEEHNKSLKHILLDDGLEEEVPQPEVTRETPKVEEHVTNTVHSSDNVTHEEAMPEGEDEPEQSELDGKGQEAIPNHQEKK